LVGAGAVRVTLLPPTQANNSPRVQALSPRFATQVCRIPTGWVGLTLYGGIAVGMWGARLSR